MLGIIGFDTALIRELRSIINYVAVILPVSSYIFPNATSQSSMRPIGDEGVVLQ